MEPRVRAFEDDLVRIPDEVILYRRIDWDKIGGRDSCPLGQAGKLNGNSFRDYPADKALTMGYPGPCMSVGVGSVLISNGRESTELLEGFDGYGLARIVAGDLRKLARVNGDQCPQGIMLAPTDTEPWHGIVFDLLERPRTRPVCKAISQVATWEIPLVNS
jgi:hypothetical protein